MEQKVLWKIGGEAGFGIMSAGLTFSKIAARSGYHTYDYVEYPSLIRGGYNAHETVFSEDVVTTLKHDIDYLVCLNKHTYEENKSRLTPESVVLYDNKDLEVNDNVGQFVSIDFRKIVHEFQGEMIMRNSIALGATVALLGADLEILFSILESEFGDRQSQKFEINQKCASAGYDHIIQNYSTFIKKNLQKNDPIVPKLVLTGNDAFALGAVIADCRLYCAYPMTPSSTVLTTLASWQNNTGMVVRHAEDEISVINTALGSSFAGVRSAVGTSGGGFALMVESISYAGVAEIPIVIFLSQRPGPATGMPTWTEQGDLLFAVHAGHGEFPKIVLAPGDVDEMIHLSTKAFDLADMYQTPVIVMSDMLLSESHQTLNKNVVDELSSTYVVNRGKIVSKPTRSDYKRYQLEPDGISEMLVPGLTGHFYQSNSYEHEEDGHTTEESQSRIDQVNKRDKKIQTYLQQDFVAPNVYGDLDASEIVFISWGSTKGVLLESIELLKQRNINVSLVHFTYVFPLDKDKIKHVFDQNKRYILVENNSTGQFGKLLRQETGIDIEEKLLKFDGRPFTTEEIINYVNRIPKH